MEIIKGGTCLVTIGSGQCKRCAIQLPRCDTSLAPLHVSCHGDGTDDFLGDGCHGNKCQQAILTQHINDSVDVQWKLSAENKVGQVSLSKLSFTAHQMALIQKSSLTWDLSLSGCSSGSSHRCISGQIVHLAWSLHNNQETYLHDLCASLSVDQDSMTFIPSSDVLDNHVIVMGAATTHMQQLAPDGALSHQFLLIFLHPGTYRVKVICQCLHRGRSRGHRGDGNESPDGSTAHDNLVTHQSPTLNVVVTEIVTIATEPTTIATEPITITTEPVTLTEAPS